MAVGGTAAALHCRHRFSLDVDCVTPRLQDRYEQVAAALESWDGWKTNRLNPPVLILGERHGIELGLRQQRRAVPLQTTRVDGLCVPTLAETLRVKACLLLQRRATRDYVDVAALAERLGDHPALAALRCLNALYPQAGAQTAATRFAEACEAEPVDLVLVPLASYKGLREPFTDWQFVADACRRLGRQLIRQELAEGLPDQVDAAFHAGGAG